LAATTTMPRKPKRNDVPVKMDAEVLRIARIVAAYEDVPLAELISETLRPILTKKLEAHQGKKTRRTVEESQA
jgi:hypothetical protein